MEQALPLIAGVVMHSGAKVGVGMGSGVTLSGSGS